MLGLRVNFAKDVPCGAKRAGLNEMGGRGKGLKDRFGLGPNRIGEGMRHGGRFGGLASQHTIRSWGRGDGGREWSATDWVKLSLFCRDEGELGTKGEQ